MTPEAQRIAIAQACGWVIDPEHTRAWGSFGQWCIDPKDAAGPVSKQNIPDYLNDLNAMHEAEKALTEDQQDTYWCLLRRSVCAGLDDMQHCFNTLHSTATQRAEAFLRAKGLWV